jgi:hypothetical protein
VNDIFILLNHDMKKSVNIKWLQCILNNFLVGRVTSLKRFFFALLRTKRPNTSIKLSSEVGFLPFQYLGIPVHKREITNKEWKIYWIRSHHMEEPNPILT